ncbi:helix-turn-helix transcriptional regulator [Nocardioides sp. KC13]|uniref:HTH-type transcriptional regulator RipA n=1 Tax=Nocardioides turkmenicus TaxID=2711220 RepID=A0A6M1R7S8_9ACTN|nr:helix-turn-helix transcriptional regulator [Nocardioides sp. KC13]NGN94741.1 helix-turn-helix transcriptional regulator [Nocardioides sp. KC13]
MSQIRHQPEAPTRVRPLRHRGEIPQHRHDDHQIAFPASGVVTITTDAGTWVAPATRALWIPAGIAHAHRAYGRVELHLVGLPSTINPLRLDRPRVLTVPPLLRELIVAYTAQPDDDRPERRRLRAVLVDQLRAAPEQPMFVPAPADPRLRQLCALLEADPADDRPLAELAREVGAGERTLSRLFRSDTGMTFPQWRTQQRLCHALILLGDGMPVTTVAHRCGWSSASAFIDTFRRIFGTTPGAYRM